MMESDQLSRKSLEHLAVANEVRFKRAADKKLIRQGRLAPADLLRDTPAHWCSAMIVDLLLAMPRIGRVKAHDWCKMESVTPTRRIRELSTRQRHMLARHIDVYALRRDDVRRSLEGR